LYDYKIQGANILLTILIASLPFYSIRMNGVSLPMVIMALCVAQALVRNLPNFTHIDVVIGLLVVLSGFWSSFAGDFILSIKGAAYFTVYIGLKSLLENTRNIPDKLMRGAYIGICLYGLLVIAASINSNIVVGDYHTMTVKLHIAINDLLGLPRDFVAANVMRNAMGEVFALFVLLPIILCRYKPADIALMMFSVIAVLATYSRRAALSIGIVLLIIAISRKEGRLKILAVGIGCASIIVLFMQLGGDNRITSMEATTRLDQYLAVINSASLLGHGYPAYVHGFMVHNFVLSHGHMMGVIGLLLALAVMALLLINARRHQLLVIPLLGLTVSGGAVGFITPVAWICIALSFRRANLITGRVRGRMSPKTS